MLQTVTGSIDAKQAGSMLVHEHVLVGFVEDGRLTPDQYDQAEVVAAIAPLLLQLKEAGCSTMVDCAPDCLGRDPYILRQLSEQTGIYLLTNTGYYKEPFLPTFVYDIPERDLADLWKREAEQGIGESGVYPGFIKIALNDGSAIDEIQLKILRAAMRASLDTGLPIQCHTIGSDVAMHAYDVMKQEVFDQERFIWVHAQTFQDDDVYRRLADEGGWISVDSISMKHYREQVDLLNQLHRLGICKQVLLSQDTGWYNVGQPGGGTINPYHHLFTDFLPAAAADGVDASWLQQCVSSHAFQAMRLRA